MTMITTSVTFMFVRKATRPCSYSFAVMPCSGVDFFRGITAGPMTIHIAILDFIQGIGVLCISRASGCLWRAIVDNRFLSPLATDIYLVDIFLLDVFLLSLCHCWLWAQHPRPWLRHKSDAGGAPCVQL